MRLLDYLVAVLALGALAYAAWWGMYQSDATAVNLEADLQSTTNAALDASGNDWAEVRMNGQKAILTGRAPSRDAVVEAAEVVLTADGAGGLIWGGVTQIESRVDAAPPVSPYVWRAVKTETGKLVLSGHVPSRATRSSLIEDAVTLSGEAGYSDQMQLASGAPGGNWQGMARLALKQVAALDMGDARLQDRVLYVSGVSMDDATRARVSADVANIAAPFRGEPSLRGASLWSATHETDVLVLKGRVSSQAERDEIARIARQHYRANVRDEMEVEAHDHQNWIEGVRLGLPHFAKFDSGDMGFAPDAGGFTFEGEATGSTLEYLREDMAKLSGPYDFAVVAEAVQVDVAEIAGIDFSADPLTACSAAFSSVLETNKVTFSTGAADITRESGETLDKLMAVAGQCDSALVFELGGHTDDQGPREFNTSLSEARAAAVAEYMERAGFDADRLSAIGYGPDVPVGDNATMNGRAENRRIEFKVLERSE